MEAFGSGTPAESHPVMINIVTNGVVKDGGSGN